MNFFENFKNFCSSPEDCDFAQGSKPDCEKGLKVGTGIKFLMMGMWAMLMLCWYYADGGKVNGIKWLEWCWCYADVMLMHEVGKLLIMGMLMHADGGVGNGIKLMIGMLAMLMLWGFWGGNMESNCWWSEFLVMLMLGWEIELNCWRWEC